MAKGMVFKGTLNGTSPIYRTFKVAASQTIKSGDIVVLDTGEAKIGADAPDAGTVLGVSNTSIVTGSTVTAADVILIDINPASIYEASYGGTGTPVIGAKYDIKETSYSFDVEDTTGGFIQVIGNINATKKTADVMLCNRVIGVA